MMTDAIIFEDHYQKWKSFCQSDEVMLSSSDDDYIDNEHFRAIVNMGEEAVPHIIEKLQTDADAHFLIHALRRITGRQFTTAEIEAAQSRYGAPMGNQGYAAIWVDWWKRRQRGAEEASS